MLILAIVLSSIIAYVIAGAWAYGYVASVVDYRGFAYDPRPVLSAVFWPIAAVVLVTGPVLSYVSDKGYRKSEKQKQIRKFRIKAEERLRIEQDRLEEEVEREIEETLRNASRR